MCLNRMVAPLMVVAGLGVSGPVWAQEHATIDAAGGYAFSYITNGDGTSLPGGWFASVGGYITPSFALVGEGTGSYKSENYSFSNAGLSFNVDANVRIYTYQAGPRFRSHPASARVFGQFLVGAATLSGSGSASGLGITASRSSSTTYFAFTPGGGVDVRATQHLGLRFTANLQLIDAEGDWGKVFQTGVGLVWTNK